MDKHRKAFKKGWKTICKIGWHNREGQVSNSLSLPRVTRNPIPLCGCKYKLHAHACIWVSFKEVFRNHTGFPKDVLQIILFRVESKTFYSAYTYIYRRSLSIDCWKSQQVLQVHLHGSPTIAYYLVSLYSTEINLNVMRNVFHGPERRTLMSLILRSFPWEHCSQGSCRMYFLIFVMNLLLP